MPSQAHDAGSKFLISAGLVIGFLGCLWLLRTRRRASPKTPVLDQEALRKQRLARLSAPGDLDDSWQARFLDAGLAEVLRTWRAQRFPSGALLMILVEDESLPSVKLRKYLWPAVAGECLSKCPTRAGEVLAARMRADGPKSKGCEPDGAVLLKMFGLPRDAPPLALFLWGTTPVRAVRFGQATDAGAFRKVLADVWDQARKDWAAKGWPGEEDQQRSRVTDMQDLQRRSAYSDLHRKMAEEMLAAHSALEARALVQRGVASAGDFVVEDVAVGLDADLVAAGTAAEHMAEREERDALRASQEREFAQSQLADEAKAEALQQAVEAAEARLIWSEALRSHMLERLPPEPSVEDASALLLSVALPGGRKLSRRWRGQDPIRAVAEFALGSATEEELPGDVPPVLVVAFPRREIGFPGDERQLSDIGLGDRELLRAELTSETRANPKEM